MLIRLAFVGGSQRNDVLGPSLQFDLQPSSISNVKFVAPRAPAEPQRRSPLLAKTEVWTEPKTLRITYLRAPIQVRVHTNTQDFLAHPLIDPQVFSMEVRGLGDVFLRSRSPILSCLTPHFSARSWARHLCVDAPSTAHSFQAYSRCSKRTFASSSNTRTTPTPVSKSEYESGTNQSRVGGGYPTDDLHRLLEEFVPPKKQSTPSVPPWSRDRIGTGLAQSTGSSAMDVLSKMRGSRDRGRVEASKMIDPKPAIFDDARISESVRAAVSTRVPQAQPRLGPSVGRSVLVEPERGIDLGRAFRNLDINCFRNTVKADFMRQRFHERPGLKRKRLRTVRWRKRFKEGFRAMVSKVEEMRRSGW